MGVKYDEEAGRRATAEGRDLATLESQVQTMEYRSERDGRGDGVVKLNASADSPEDGGGQALTEASSGAPEPNLKRMKDQLEVGETLDKADTMLNEYKENFNNLASNEIIQQPEEKSLFSKAIDSINPLSATDAYGSENGPRITRKAYKAIPGEDNTPLYRLTPSYNKNDDFEKVSKDRNIVIHTENGVWTNGKFIGNNAIYEEPENINQRTVWFFNNRDGGYELNGELKGVGYSGNGEGLNNPELINKENIGPTPNGYYVVAKIDESKGALTAHINETNPDFTKEIKRVQFTFKEHGDLKENKFGAASEGCIILPPQIRKLMKVGDVVKVITK